VIPGRVFLLAALGSLFIARIVFAHPDYEQPLDQFRLQDANGDALKLVRHYTDGIVCGDPVKLLIYDSRGKELAETGYYREILIERTSDGRLQVYGVGMFSFWDEWVLENGKLQKSRSLALSKGLMASLKAQWPGYVIWLVLSLGAVLVYRRRFKGRSSGCLVSAAWIWLMGTLMYGSLCISLMLGFTTIGALPILWFFRAKQPVKQEPKWSAHDE
jgi:hypothetical protein